MRISPKLIKVKLVILKAAQDNRFSNDTKTLLIFTQLIDPMNELHGQIKKLRVIWTSVLIVLILFSVISGWIIFVNTSASISGNPMNDQLRFSVMSLATIGIFIVCYAFQRRTESSTLINMQSLEGVVERFDAYTSGLIVKYGCFGVSGVWAGVLYLLTANLIHAFILMASLLLLFIHFPRKKQIMTIVHEAFNKS